MLAAGILAAGVPLAGVVVWQTYEWRQCKALGNTMAAQAESTQMVITPVVDYSPVGGCTMTVFGTKVKLQT